MYRISPRALSGTATALLVAVSGLPLAAQTSQTTFTACRVPDVGAIYMIGVSGAPGACLDASHIEFSWTEGGSGTPADGSITTAKLADEAVTSAKIADATITSSDIAVGTILSSNIATDAVGSDEIIIDGVGADEIAPGAVGVSEIASNGVGDSELGLEVVSEVRSSVSGQFDNVTATCPSGKVAIGGGFDINVAGTPNAGSSFHATESHITGSNGWQAVGYWPSTQTGWGWTVTVICVIDS